MKKKLTHDHENKINQIRLKQSCKLCNQQNDTQKRNSLFLKNYFIISQTLNKPKNRQQSLSIINTLVEKEPSKSLIFYLEIQKNLVNQEYLMKYFELEKLKQKIKKIISKNASNLKSNYMDFKVKNYYILNKYKVTQIRNLPYPLWNKLQKQSTDSKLSSTKSIQNKVLPDLQFQIKQRMESKRKIQLDKQNFNKKSNNKQIINKKPQNQKFQIKNLINNLQDMIQGIQDVRKLQKFKKQMSLESKFTSNMNFYNKTENRKQILKTSNNLKAVNSGQSQTKRQKQFKQRVQNDMVKLFTDCKQKNFSKQRKFDLQSNKDIYGMIINKNKSKDSIIDNNYQKYNKNQRLKTQYDPQFQEYGLSVIRQKGRKSKDKLQNIIKKQKQKQSKSKQINNKSKLKSKSKSKNSSSKYICSSKRLQTQYSCTSSQRMNTVHGELIKSKSSSRIPTQYDSTLIFKQNTSKSKSKYENMSTNPTFYKKLSVKIDNQKQKDQSKSSRMKSKSKSKSKINLFQFKSPTKLKKINN